MQYMKFKFSIWQIIFTLIFVIPAFPQNDFGVKDFSGKWIWQSKNNSHQLEINLKNNEIELKETIQSKDKKKIERQSNFFTDGRGETNKYYDNEVTQSVTSFRKNKIMIDFIFTDPKSNKKIKSGSIELKLKDNNKLIWTENNLLFNALSGIFGSPQTRVKTFEKII